jgi:LysR substrate binding domain
LPSTTSLEQGGELAGRRVVERQQRRSDRSGGVPHEPARGLDGGRVALALQELAERPQTRPQLAGGREVDVVDQQPVQLHALLGHDRGRAPDDCSHAGGERGERQRVPAVEEGRAVGLDQLGGGDGVFYDAESADEDPIRRQLAERAQALGIRLRPKVEVELKDIALRLVAAGVGDTYLPSAYTRAPYYSPGLSAAPFSPALYDTFAVITRPGARLSPGVRELLADLEAHLRAVADELS